MKRVISIAVAMITILTNFNTVNASYEKVQMNESIINAKQTPNSSNHLDTSGLMCTTQPTYGNEIYLQVTTEVNGTNIGSLPDKYKNSEYSNSPIYVYDENLSLIKNIEFNGVIPGFEFIDGYFYFQQIIYDKDVYDQEAHYYKSVNMNDWIELTYDEYMFIKRKVILMDGTAYSWKNVVTELPDGTTRNEKIKNEYLVNDNGDIFQILREDEKYLSGGCKQSTDFNVYILGKKSIENFNSTDKEITYISLDGLSMFQIPNDINMSDIWNDDEFIYIGIIRDETQCYRIPIKDMLDCIKIKYNNQFLSFATNPTTEEGRTLVPMRFLFEQMGARVDWDNLTQTATVNKNDDIISFSIDNSDAIVNGANKTMEVPARIIDGKTMIPLRFLSEELGYTVLWDNETNTVTIHD